jgi:hypothetical protein
MAVRFSRRTVHSIRDRVVLIVHAVLARTDDKCLGHRASFHRQNENSVLCHLRLHISRSTHQNNCAQCNSLRRFQFDHR